MLSTHIQYAYTSDQHQAGPSTWKPTRSMKLRPVDPTSSWDDHEATCLISRWSMGMVRSLLPFIPSLPSPPQPTLFHIYASIPMPLRLLPQSLSHPFTSHPLFGASILPLSLTFPTSLSPSPFPPPPPTKTKRYAPLHLIDPTSLTEGKTMREAAGGRSAWIS